MNHNRANVVRVCFEARDFLCGVCLDTNLRELRKAGSNLKCCSCTPEAGSRRCRILSCEDSPSVYSDTSLQGILSYQFFRAMKRPARTGTSVSSNVFTIAWELSTPILSPLYTVPLVLTCVA